MHNWPDRVEWDFSECPHELLQECKDYEYARLAIKHAPHLFANLKVSEKEPPHYFLSNGFEVWLPTGFPKVPFLKLKRDLQESSFLKGVYKYIDTRPLFLAENDKEKSSKYCYPICINLDASQTKLAAAFKKLIEQLRKSRAPNEIPTARKPRKIAAMRPASITKKLQSDLKKIGVYRLLECGTVEQAMAHTEQISRNRKPLFQDFTDWSKAKREVIKGVKEFTGVLLPTNPRKVGL